MTAACWTPYPYTYRPYKRTTWHLIRLKRASLDLSVDAPYLTTPLHVSASSDDRTAFCRGSSALTS